MDSLPSGEVLPIITALEDNFAKVEMGELTPTDGGISYAVDLRNEPIITSKSFIMNWYDTTSREPIQEGILDEMQSWGLDSDTLSKVVKFIAAWSAGDYTVTKIGSELVTFEKMEEPVVLDSLGKVFDFGLTALDLTRASYGVYLYLNRVPNVSGLSTASKTSAWADIKNICKEIQSVRTGALGKIGTVSRCLQYAGNALTAGVAIYTFFDVASRSGWSTLGVAVALYYVDMILAYALVIEMVAMIPYVGWILALGIVISDAIGGWFGDLVDEILTWFYDTEIRNEFDVDVDNLQFDFDDYDNNGLDVGDRFDLQADLTRWVYVTQYGSPNDLNAYLNVELDYLAANVFDHDTIHMGLGHETDYTTYEAFSNRNTLWIEPSVAKINFPWTVSLSYDFRLFYNEWVLGYGWERVSQDDSGSQTLTTIYVDVLPGNVNDFVAWNAITSLDIDGDGLEDAVEGKPGSSYKISGKENDLSLTLSGGSTNGLEMVPYEGLISQKWTVEPIGDGYYKIAVKSDGRCLTVQDGSMEDGAAVIGQIYQGADSQKWKMELGADGYYRFTANHSGKYLSVQDFTLIQESYSGADYQKWVLEPIECPSDLATWDTDDDGLSDRFEVEYWLEPTNSDTDGDGVIDGLEFRFGTEPKIADTDGDGLTDAEEYAGWDINFTYSGQLFITHVWSDPRRMHSDDDGLTDYEEFLLGLNPRSSDTDGDGFKDSIDTIDNLLEIIDSLDLPDGIKGALSVKLNHAQTKLEMNKFKTSSNMLNAFINHVKAQQGKKISAEEADAIIAEAQRIIDSLTSSQQEQTGEQQGKGNSEKEKGRGTEKGTETTDTETDTAVENGTGTSEETGTDTAPGKGKGTGKSTDDQTQEQTDENEKGNKGMWRVKKRSRS
ncbi:MAG: hypothetical protein GTN80_10315 [Nitrososphaeria archaeon]|nr:hypothetical protein [Nitrososphaeria archaeon]NIQ34016.1 hypothetical protein [Nitrososphaeria archaeon]